MAWFSNEESNQTFEAKGVTNIQNALHSGGILVDGKDNSDCVRRGNDFVVTETVTRGGKEITRTVVINGYTHFVDKRKTLALAGAGFAPESEDEEDEE